MRRIVSVGVDIAQRHDYLAVVVAETTGNPDTDDHSWRLVYCDRVRDLDYEQAAHAIVALLARVVAQSAGAAVVVALDHTGVGAPVCDRVSRLLDDRTRASLLLRKIIVSAGELVVRGEGGRVSVPKVQLVGALQLAVNRRKLDLSALEADDRKLLLGEMASFRAETTPSGRTTFNAEAGSHDDLLSATSLCVWAGEAARGAVMKVFTPVGRLAPTGTSRVAAARIPRAPGFFTPDVPRDIFGNPIRFG